MLCYVISAMFQQYSCYSCDAWYDISSSDIFYTSKNCVRQKKWKKILTKKINIMQD